MNDDLKQADCFYHYEKSSEEREELIERIELLENYIDQSGNFLCHIIDQLYSQESFISSKFEADLSSLCELLDVYFPAKEKLQIARNPTKLSQYARELVQLNQDCLRQQYQ